MKSFSTQEVRKRAEDTAQWQTFAYQVRDPWFNPQYLKKHKEWEKKIYQPPQLTQNNCDNYDLYLTFWLITRREHFQSQVSTVVFKVPGSGNTEGRITRPTIPSNTFLRVLQFFLEATLRNVG